MRVFGAIPMLFAVFAMLVLAVSCNKEKAPAPPTGPAAATATPTSTSTPDPCTVTPLVTPTPETTEVPNTCVGALEVGIVTTGQRIWTGTFPSYGDNDYYRFQAGTTGTHTFILDCLDDASSALSLYNDACDNELAAGTGTATKTITYALISGVFYRVRTGILSGTVATSYRLTIIAP